MKYSIESATLTGIGDAIRGKEGTSTTIPVKEMASRISNLPSGGSNLTYIYVAPSNALSGYGRDLVDVSAYGITDFSQIKYINMKDVFYYADLGSYSVSNYKLIEQPLYTFEIGTLNDKVGLICRYSGTAMTQWNNGYIIGYEGGGN